MVEQTWKEAAKAALKDGQDAPERPEGCDAGPRPHIPRVVVNDGTIERLGAILANQPRGTLQMRYELSEWSTEEIQAAWETYNAGTQGIQ